MIRTQIKSLFLLLALLGLLPSAKAQLTFTTNNEAITITGYNTAAGLNVVIPASTNGYPVVSIGDEAFYNLPITNVTIPNSVTSIGSDAFLYCSSLTNIIVDAANPSYASAGGVLFDKNLLTLIECPKGLAGSYAIPNSVTSIGSDAFSYCSSLTSVTIPNSVTSIGSDAFFYCSSLTSVTIPSSVTSIGSGAFEGCSSLTSVTIPNSVTSIGNYTFYSCTNLFSITVPASVTSIDSSAFASCSKLTEIYFQGNAPVIDPTAFQGVNSAMTVYYLPNTTGWDVAFGGFPTAITPLPNGVTSVGNLPAVFYPPAGTNYTLQMSTNPASGNWMTVSNTVVLNALQVTNLASAAFFRLQAASGSVPSPTIVSYGHLPVWIYPTNATYSLQMKTNLAAGNWLSPSGNTFVSVQITNAPAGAIFRLH